MLTLAKPTSYEEEIKRSRFIVHAARVDSMQETLDFFESVADPQANHNCWAWRLDYQYRFNDDGEPASSAGKPIFAAIDGKQLDHVMVVVTRYFGGIKLGVGGLIRAYGGTAAKCLDIAGILEIKPKSDCLIKGSFEWTGQIHNLLNQYPAEKINEHFDGNGVQILVRLEEAYVSRLKRSLRDACRGQVQLEVLDQEK